MLRPLAQVLTSTAFASILKPMIRLRLILLAGLVVFCALTGQAQWVTQTITLRPGWNAVYLEVEPEPASCDSIFSKAPLESVWAWNRKFSPVQFIQDTDQLVASRPDWLNYLPPSQPASKQNTLFTLEGGRTYLIKTRTNSAPYTFTLVGTPTLRKVSWLANSFNFVGFSVSTSAPPTFQAFFQPSSAHANKPLYRLAPNGHWVPVSASSTTMQSGEAFWIYTSGESDYAGPLQITLDQSTGLDYGRALTDQTLRIKNLSSSAQRIVVNQLPSAAHPLGPFPALAGAVPLSYWNMSFAAKQFWVPLPARLTNTTLQPTQDWAL